MLASAWSWIWSRSSSNRTGLSLQSPPGPTESSHISPSILPESSPLGQSRLVKVTMGICTVVHPRYGRCDCAEGSSIGNSDAVVICDSCLHPMSYHEEYPSHPRVETSRWASPLEGRIKVTPHIRRPLHSDICRRADTVQNLAGLLDKHYVVHVRGTPSSGKTTLASLLWIHYNDQGKRVVFVPYWLDNNDPNWLLSELCRLAGYVDVTPVNVLSTDIVFIVDEAQSSYFDRLTWLQVVKFQSNRRAGAKICLFASYGSPTSGSPTIGNSTIPFRSTPVRLGPQQRVSLTTSRVPGTPDVCLFYNEEEFNDALRRLCSRPSTACNFSPDAGSYLYSITNGHAGAVTSMMNYIYDTYYPLLKKGFINQITKKHILDSLEDERSVFRSIQPSPVFRSFPSKKCLTMPAANCLQKVLEKKVVPCDLGDEGIKLCYEMGWVHSDAIDEDDDEIVCFLPSKLHEKFVEFFLPLHYNSHPFPLEQFPSPTALCEAVLRRFSRKNLLSSRNGTSAIRPPEAVFQDEWYRAFYALVGHGVAICSEWSSTGDGRIDFRIKDPAWGIELLRDGDRLSEHCNRFEPQGSYYRWVTQGLINDWLVLDCRHSIPQKYNVPGTKIWRVVFKQDYSSVLILDNQNKTAVPEFPLLN